MNFTWFFSLKLKIKKPSIFSVSVQVNRLGRYQRIVDIITVLCTPGYTQKYSEKYVFFRVFTRKNIEKCWVFAYNRGRRYLPTNPVGRWAGAHRKKTVVLYKNVVNLYKPKLVTP